jgi:hypothetical protein
LAFRKPKRTLTEAPTLQLFDLDKPIIFSTHARAFATVGILNQHVVFRVLRPLDFYSRKCSPQEQNYNTYDRELLAIVEELTQ